MLLVARICYPEDKVDNDGQQQDDGQEGRTKAVVEAGLSTHSDGFRTPVIGDQSIYHRKHRNAREKKGADERGAVTEVEHADGEGTEDDGEVEP